MRERDKKSEGRVIGVRARVRERDVKRFQIGNRETRRQSESHKTLPARYTRRTCRFPREQKSARMRTFPGSMQSPMKAFRLS